MSWLRQFHKIQRSPNRQAPAKTKLQLKKDLQKQEKYEQTDERMFPWTKFNTNNYQQSQTHAVQGQIRESYYIINIKAINTVIPGTLIKRLNTSQ